ncbi:type II toxin-antitoxin system RelE/ParE family toxin [Campylobacter sp. JMF_08 NE1]|uniref:type II toxin-antitoxin system RelE/ParE family toxin n=1 Tax=Campylobacter sp. JMF_08 NE1 TaxID=2983821 RepID=UPI0022E9E059|nr:type II toxin-antitoxin system RelE/ParE family toxin [Campylobacter sp. JMF_08 NE1]MDA3047578.1 type II toxin-antitoxin system RelE/ParE family toxin [Campylobacter sp. JMF_08 NE1]
MTIIYNDSFENSLNEIIDFIAQDSIERAVKFHNDIYQKISNITFMPYRYRRNKILNDKNVRDLIFKGYIIPFEIKKDKIEILTIFKENLPKFKRT